MEEQIGKLGQEVVRMKKKLATKRIPNEKREMVKVLAVQGLSEREIGRRLNIRKTGVNTIKNEIDDLDQLRVI